jgi:hypothetical protein
MKITIIYPSDFQAILPKMIRADQSLMGANVKFMYQDEKGIFITSIYGEKSYLCSASASSQSRVMHDSCTRNYAHETIHTSTVSAYYLCMQCRVAVQDKCVEHGHGRGLLGSK